MRKPFIAGNWKMNTDKAVGISLAEGIAAKTEGITGEMVDVALLPPFVYLQSVNGAISHSNIALGAQDIYFEEKGAFTGEISAAMLKDVGCSYVLCGHSERRHVLGETDEIVNKKVKASISGGLLPILCVGELLEERKGEKTADVVSRQVREGLAGLNAEKMAAVTLAYEPVWAIGTGLTASPEEAQEVHSLIRGLLAKLYDSSLAKKVRIQYGGSAKPDNAAKLMGCADIDGLLVGGASLRAEDFTAIIKASK